MRPIYSLPAKAPDGAEVEIEFVYWPGSPQTRDDPEEPPTIEFVRVRERPDLFAWGVDRLEASWNNAVAIAQEAEEARLDRGASTGAER